jgi:uncharacterized membrane protein
MTNNRKIDRYYISLIILCIIVFSFLCFHLILNRCLWGDEFTTIITVRRPFIDGLLQLQDYSAPLYQLLLRLIVFSDNPPAWLIRSPALIFAVLGLISSWFFIKQLFGEKVALATMILVACNPVYIFYSTEARPYSLFFLLTVLSMWTFYNLLIKYNIKNMISYIMTTSLLLYAHYLGLFTMVGQVLFAISVLFLQKNRLLKIKNVFYAFGFILLISSPSLFLMSRFIFSGVPGTAGWIDKPSAIALVSMDKLFGSNIISVFFVISVIIEILGLFVILHDDFSWHVKSKEQNIVIYDKLCQDYNILFVLFWLIFNFYIVIFISMTIIPIYEARYLLPAILPITVIITITINRIYSQKIILGIMLYLLIILPFAANIGNIQNTRKPYYYQLVNYLQHNYNAHTEIFVPDWAYCDNFINPDLYGLRYYGLKGIKIKLLKLNYPYNIFISHPEQLLVDKHIYIVCFIGIIKDKIELFLRTQGKTFRKINFGVITVFDIEKDGDVLNMDN